MICTQKNPLIGVGFGGADGSKVELFRRGFESFKAL